MKLTAPNGEKVDVRRQDIISLHANTGAYHPNAKTVVVVEHYVLGLKVQAVQETVDEIEALTGKL